eukprot:3060290-Amphidinium_carterae.3
MISRCLLLCLELTSTKSFILPNTFMHRYVLGTGTNAHVISMLMSGAAPAGVHMSGAPPLLAGLFFTTSPLDGTEVLSGLLPVDAAEVLTGLLPVAEVA